MPIVCLTCRRCILLLILLMSAAPLRPSPIDGEAESALALTTWNWPVEKSISKNFYRNVEHNGSPLPKFATGEMANEFSDAFAKAFNFPLLPMSLNERRWRLWHQRYGKLFKDLQMQQTTWLDELQSPADDATMTKPKRAPILWPPTEAANYDYAYVRPEAQRMLKREPANHKGPLFRPSISAGAMTNLGDFFNRLRANVQFAEHSQQLGEAESKLLEGAHRHASDWEEDRIEEAAGGNNSGQTRDRKPAAKLRQSEHSYRPSQKIRSLVSRNPNGYRGSQFIDPSYMWLGLGK